MIGTEFWTDIVYDEQQFSQMVSSALDSIGYSYEQILLRRELVERGWKQQSVVNDHLSFVICGSLAEGIEPRDLSAYGVNDCSPDVIGVAKNIFCADDAATFKTFSGTTVFQIERGPDITPGNVVLRFFKCENAYLRALLLKSGEFFHNNFVLSRQHFIALFIADRNNTNLLRSIRYPNYDTVVGFQCFCPGILDKWKFRPRLYWPSEDDIKKVCWKGAIIVPSKVNESPNQDVEWRMSFANGENVLCFSLSSASIKVYILLRLLFGKKQYFSYYQLKTAVFWITEKSPKHVNEGMLISQTIRVMNFLKQCVKNCFLPHYVNSSWNVLTKKQTTCQRKQLLLYTKHLLAEEASMVLRIAELTPPLAKIYREPKKLKLSDGKDLEQPLEILQLVL